MTLTVVPTVISILLLRRSAKRKEEILQEGYAIIGKYSKELGRERFSQGCTDAYGIRRYDKWETKGIEYFLTRVLLEQHSASELVKSNDDIRRRILAKIDEVATENEFSNHALPSIATGEEYELFCERELIQCGWDVKRTPTSGDHGIDLIAERGEIRICLQCKYYSSKVGNSAVQEASAGCQHYQGTHTGVVSNNSFTKAAISLAETNMVLLLHHTDLKRLEEMLGNESQKRQQSSPKD
ncbi:restriction endonuclease [Synechococcus sp. FGCU-3]|nr:restriction endonuclease [Synechococcus sp. FGCU3]